MKEYRAIKTIMNMKMTATVMLLLLMLLLLMIMMMMMQWIASVIPPKMTIHLLFGLLRGKKHEWRYL